MKYILTTALILISLISFGQHATLERDTIRYNSNAFTVGDTVHLFYGSGNDKKFAFIQYGGGLLGLEKLDSRYSKSDVIVDKVYKQSGKYYLRGKLVSENIPGYKVFIDIEGAVDNKELKE